MRDRATLVQLLSLHIDSTAKPGVKNPADLIIPYRIKTGELKLYGHGHLVLHDLFITGGKATWAIEELVGVDRRFPEINEGLPKDERAKRVAEIRRFTSSFTDVVSYLLEPDYPTMDRMIRTWRTYEVQDRLPIVELLAGHLENAQKVGLQNHANNVKIVYRLKTGDMRPGPFKKHTEQDLYIVGGKAAFAIGELIRPIPFRELPEITEGQSDDERAKQALLVRMCVASYTAGVQQGLAPKAPIAVPSPSK